jgi:putative oxidoreductase
MEPITRTLASTDDSAALPIQPNVFQEKSVALLRTTAAAWDQHIVGALHRWSIPALRLALGLVFVWFGALKVFGVSPVTPMLRETYAFLALPGFTSLLGAWEMLIGIGLVSKLALRQTLYLMCLHLAGTFAALWLAPSHFFLHDNPLVLTVDGEFVVKNLVLLTAGLVIGSNEASRLTRRVVQTPMRRKERTNEGVAEGGSTQP